MLFFVGLHHPADARHFGRCMVSANALRGRRSAFPAQDWILDSGAFTLVSKHGGYPNPPEEYARVAARWSHCGNLLAAVTQDFPCEPHVLDRTGHTVADHQRLTVERYAAIRAALPSEVPLMPVLQGWEPEDYARCASLYGPLLPKEAWCGVGSLCRRNRRPAEVARILLAVREARSDLRLHAFGAKITALSDPVVRALLFSADSMAWSFAARRQGRNPNDWREAARFARRIEAGPPQEPLFVS